jgi:hypothetical protein
MGREGKFTTMSKTLLNDNRSLILCSGQGTYFYADGDMYVGQWRNDERHGRGVMTYSKSDANAVQEKYDGEFAEGKMSGRGCYWLRYT